MSADALRPLADAPGPPSLPVVAGVPWVLSREGPVAGLQAMGERYRAEGLFRVRFPAGLTAVFVVDADLATELCDESRWEKGLDGPALRVREFAGDGLFTAYNHEPSWGHAHRILAPAFSREAMGRYFPAMREVAGELVAHWRRARGPVDVVADTTRLTLDTISLCGFDHRFRSFERPTLDPFLQALGRALQEAIEGVNRPPVVPAWEAMKRRQLDADVATMSATVDAVIRARRALPPASWPRDLLSLMLTERDPRSGEGLTDANIRYQILTFLTAGHETTAGLLSFTLHQLARSPTLAARLRDEVRRVVGDGEPTLEQVGALGLVDRALRESLRLWPTVPAFSRVALEDTTLGGRWRVAKGEQVVLLLGAIHRDPRHWPEPSRFDPDRFLPEASKARASGAWRPFGVGRRTCTGRHFAMVEAALCLALVLREFDLDPPGPLRLAPTATAKPRGFKLGVRPRR